MVDVCEELDRSLPFSHPPDVEWEDRTRTLVDIVTKGKYPCFIKLKCDDLRKQCPGIRILPSLGVSVLEDECVLRVLEMRRYKMVAAMKLHWDRRSMEYHETGKQIDINVTQSGERKL